MSEKKEETKQPLKDVTGKELGEKDLADVSGGMRSDCSYMCGTNPNSKGSYVDAG